MKLSNIKITKFRSIESANISVNTTQALVGENNVGKSSLLKALNCFFHPDIEKVNLDSGKHSFLKTTVSKILLTFESTVFPFPLDGLTDGNKLHIEFTYKQTSKKHSYNYYKNGECKSLPMLAFPELLRNIDYIYIPPTRSDADLKWDEEVVLREIVQKYLSRHFSRRDTISSKYRQAASSLNTGALKKVSKEISSNKLLSNNLNIEISVPEDLTYLDYMNYVNVVIKEGEQRHSIDQCGTGIQSLSIISLYKILAKLSNANIIVGIEEPETNLHPQAQKSLIRSLIRDNEYFSQLFFTTHSTTLTDAVDHTQILLFRKEKHSRRDFKTTIAQLPEDFWEYYGLHQEKYYKFHQYRNSEFFFSKFVIVVESSNDAEIFKLLLDQKSINIDDYPVSILNLEGVENIKYPLYLLKNLIFQTSSF